MNHARKKGLIKNTENFYFLFHISVIFRRVSVAKLYRNNKLYLKVKWPDIAYMIKIMSVVLI